MAAVKQEILGTGRRKTSVARVRVSDGKGKITVNNRELNEYFKTEREQVQVLEPLIITGKRETVDIRIRCSGGGPNSQAGAVKMALARALRIYDASLDDLLRHSGLLTRDSRMKERKHYGLRGARRGTQFSKR
jgi:small subunit ribosomal protein S9